MYWSTLQVPISGDANSHVYLAHSLIRDGDAEIGECAAQPPPYACLVWSFGEHRYAPYLPGNALLYAPLALLAEAFDIRPPAFVALAVLPKLWASLLVSLSVTLTYLLVHTVVDRRPALLLTYAYAFGTFAFAIASQVLWEHAATLAAVAAATLLAFAPVGVAHRAGLAVGVAVLVRPQNILFALGCLAFLWFRRRGSVVGYIAWGLPAAAVLVVYNTIALGSPFATTRVWLPGTDTFAGMLGLLVSPSRGLFVYAPFLLAGLVALIASWRPTFRGRAVESPAGDRVVFLRIMTLVFAGNLVLHGSHLEWWGGWAYGNRYISDLAPVYLLALAHVWRPWVAGAWARATLAIAVGWAVLLQALGAAFQYYYWNGLHWDANPDITLSPERLWSWTDTQWQWMLSRLVNEPGPRVAFEGLALAMVTCAFALLAEKRPGASRAPR